MRPGVLSVIVAMTVTLGLGMLVLGFDWHGHEIAPGVWRDGVALWRWGLLWGLLVIVGAAAAGLVPSLGVRLLAMTPLLVWYGWMLRDSALGPVAWSVYATPTVGAWLGGLAAGQVMRARWHAP